MLHHSLFGVTVVFPIQRQNIKEILAAKRKETATVSQLKGISIHSAAAETQDQLNSFIDTLQATDKANFQYLVESEQKIHLLESREILSKLDGLIMTTNDEIIEREIDSANGYGLVYALAALALLVACIAYFVS